MGKYQGLPQSCSTPSYIYHHIEICEQDGWIDDAFILWDFILFSFLFFISKKENRMRKKN